MLAPLYLRHGIGPVKVKPDLKLLKKVLRAILLAPVLLVLLFEEWGWIPLAQIFARLGRLPCWTTLEQLVTRLSPWAALAAFSVPALALIPVKLFALYLFAGGYFGFGLLMLMTAKVMGTALAARLFQLTQPALMRMPWFARLYTRWKIWKDNLLNHVRVSKPWKTAQCLKSRIKAQTRVGWRRLKAIVASTIV